MADAQVTQQSITSESPSVWSFRLLLVCLVALSVSLPMAWISLAKVLLFVFGLIYLVANHFSAQRDSDLEGLWTTRVILGILFTFSLSLFWTAVDKDVAAISLVKHSKLIEIILLASLVRTAQEARTGIAAFVTGQVFLLLSSWLLAAGVPIPWVTVSSNFQAWSTKHVVFSSYLDQSVMFATTAAIFWHLRSDQLWPRWLGALLAGAALTNVFLLLEGRTGYVVALSMLLLSAIWAMQKHLRFKLVIVIPLIVLSGFLLKYPPVNDRLDLFVHDVAGAVIQSGNKGSSVWRLNAWNRSVQAIQERPMAGYGAGSWAMVVKRLEGDAATDTFGPSNISNPHQEYLLWGVELGLGGILLLLSLIFCVVRDAQRFKPSVKRATVSVIAAIAIASMFNSALYDALIGDFLCVVLGLLMALGLRNQPAQSDLIKSAPYSKRSKAVL